VRPVSAETAKPGDRQTRQTRQDWGILDEKAMNQMSQAMNQKAMNQMNQMRPSGDESDERAHISAKTETGRG
jgi:hypothetical protein